MRKPSRYKRTKPNVKRKARTAKTLTVREVARYTGIGINAVYQLIRNGELPSFDVGGRKRYVLPIRKFPVRASIVHNGTESDKTVSI